MKIIYQFICKVITVFAALVIQMLWYIQLHIHNRFQEFLITMLYSCMNNILKRDQQNGGTVNVILHYQKQKYISIKVKVYQPNTCIWNYITVIARWAITAF